MLISVKIMQISHSVIGCSTYQNGFLLHYDCLHIICNFSLTKKFHVAYSTQWSKRPLWINYLWDMFRILNRWVIQLFVTSTTCTDDRSDADDTVHKRQSIHRKRHTVVPGYRPHFWQNTVHSIPAVYVQNR